MFFVLRTSVWIKDERRLIHMKDFFENFGKRFGETAEMAKVWICRYETAVPHRRGYAAGRDYLAHSDEYDTGWAGTALKGTTADQTVLQWENSL